MLDRDDYVLVDVSYLLLTEKTAERSVPVTLVYAVTTVMALTFFGVIATVALTIFFKTVSGT